MTLVSIWNELEGADATGSGYAIRRVHSDTDHDLFVAVGKPSQRRVLIFETPENLAPASDDLPRTKAITLRVEPAAGGRVRLVLELVQVELVDLFSAVVSDMASAAAAEPTTAQGIQAFLRRFEHWRDLFEAIGPDGLNPAARRGLFGELFVLDQLVEAGADATASIRAWTGPLRAHQDFQFPTVAIEVKTTAAKQPQTLVITSERELDDTGVDALFLAHLSFDERRGGAGSSLRSLIEGITARVGGLDIASELRAKLQAVGYLSVHEAHYAEPRYELRAARSYRVEGDFPRIVEGQLRNGVGDVKYRLSTAACVPFEHDWDAMLHEASEDA